MMFFTARNESKRLVLVPLCAWVQSHGNHVWLFATPWTAVHQAPLPMEFSRQECWSDLPCPSPGDLPNPGIKPIWAGGFFTINATWEDWVTLTSLFSRLMLLFFFFFFNLGSYSLTLNWTELPYLGIHDPPSILLLWVFMYVKWVYYRLN